MKISMRAAEAIADILGMAGIYFITYPLIGWWKPMVLIVCIRAINSSLVSRKELRNMSIVVKRSPQ